VVSTLLPGDAEITAEPAEPLEEAGEVAAGEPMLFRLRVEAPGGPLTTRFLHVLQGVDADGDANEAVYIESTSGTPFAGAAVNGVAVLFPVDLDQELAEIRYAFPSGTTRHLITGLVPDSAYDIVSDATTITVRPGTAQTADEAGVLELNLQA
jgi:hypothetical protein